MTVTSTPEPGRPAPDFTLPASGGGEVTLSDLRPRRVVLFFYPKDNTPGCTTEALDFTARLGAFREAGVEVIGISRDSLRRHENFRRKHGLQTTLLSDAEGTVCEDYGVWKEKNMYGKTFWGIERSTFLVGPDGTIERAWRKVRVPGHADEVLVAAQEG